MLKKETIEKIKGFGFDVDKLIAAIKAEAETDYTVPEDVTVIKTTDLEARDANKMAEGKRTGETEGERKGKELAAKAFKKKFSLDDAVSNEVDKVVEAVNAKLNKGDAGLQEQITLLQKDKEALLAEKGQLETRAKEAASDMQLISYFPTKRTADFSDEERLLLLKKNLTFEEVNGVMGVKKNGEFLREKGTQALLPVKQAIEDLFTERKWVTADASGAGGRGGGDTAIAGTGGVKKYSEFLEKWKAENPGVAEVSPEFSAAVGKHSKDTPDFDFYN